MKKILEDSLDSIPSPSNYERESWLEVKRQNIAGYLQQSFCSTKFVDNTQPSLAKEMKKKSNVHNSLKVMGSNLPFEIFSTLT